MSLPNYAGLRSFRKNRQTGTLVGVYDGEPAGMDTDGGRWQTVCELHGGICSHLTLSVAMHYAARPLEWCGECQDNQSTTGMEIHHAQEST